MEITQADLPPATLMTLIGRLDTLTAPNLEGIVKQVIAQNKSKFILDLTQLDYISSSGLRVLLMFQKQLKSLGGKSILVNVKPDIKYIFEKASNYL